MKSSELKLRWKALLHRRPFEQDVDDEFAFHGVRGVWTGAGAGLLAAVWSVSLLAALAAAQVPVFRSDTRIVEVAVVAKDSSGSPITDLRKEDLRVFDNGVEQTILSLEKLGGSVQTTGRPARRLSVIVLDALNTGWGAQIYGREAVSQMLGKLPAEVDRIAIFALGDELHFLHDFSTDTASLRAAVDHYDGEQPLVGVSEGSKTHDDPFAAFYQEQRWSRTLDALTAIASIMKDAQGEKNVLWVTAGLPPPASHQDIEGAMRDLAAAKVMLYPVDARGVLASFQANVNVESMKELAEQTGGRVFYNDNDTAALVRAALDDSREGYVLTYAPRDHRQDGAAHQVRLKTSRKGVELRYRLGYFADSATK
jgi:VWFA-related protein